MQLIVNSCSHISNTKFCLGCVAAVAACMWPIVTDRVVWSVSLSVCSNPETCNNGWTDRDAIWDVDLSGPKELCEMGSSQIPPWGEAFLKEMPLRFCPHAAEHHSQWPWCRDFPTCCQPSFRLASCRSSRISH